MADNSGKIGGGAAGKSGHAAGSSRTERFAKRPVPDIPPSKPLQWFLLVAFLISGAAYVVQEWTEKNPSQTQGQRPIMLERQVQSQSKYLEHCKAGDEALAQKRYDQAVSEYRLALQSQNDASGHEFLGEALLKEGNPDAAFAEFREALRMDPNLVKASSVWGLALMAEGKPEEATNILGEGLQRHPEAGLLHYNMATAVLEMRTDVEGRRRMAASAGKTQEAQAAQTEADGLAADALRHFIKASGNGVDSPAFWCGYGQLLNQLGHYGEAKVCLDRAVSEDASVTAAHFQLAMAEDHLGKYAEAIAHYEKVLVLTPDDAGTLNNMALLYATATNAEARSPKMAVQLAMRACDATTSQNARYMDTLARSYAADGNFFQAIAWEDKALHRARQLSDEDLARELQGRYALFLEHKTQ
jgi:tetratricopeptide (TPR) repeat protein